MNLLLGLPFVVVVGGLLFPLLFLDGAAAYLRFVWENPSRVAALVAVNPWARSPQAEASARLKHYYLRRFTSLAFWRKVLSGKFDIGHSAGSLAGDLRGAASPASKAAAPGYLQRMHEGWTGFARPVLFLLSGTDLTAREFEAWVAADRQRADLFHGPTSELTAFADSDHTFSSSAWRDAVNERTIEWIGRISPRC